MPIPLVAGQPLDLTVVGFCAVVHKNSGIGFFHQNVFHTGICPEELPITGLMRVLNLSAASLGSELRRCLSSHGIEPAGDFFLTTSL